jgi:hypothetical protein
MLRFQMFRSLRQHGTFSSFVYYFAWSGETIDKQ